MSVLITVDGGTSTTRVGLWRDCHIVDCMEQPSGVRDSQDLASSIVRLIDGLCSRNGVSADRVLGSGMITSERGLTCVPHLSAPVGIDDLAQGLHPSCLPNGVTIHLVPGVKNSGKLLPDMMRGEETETFGLLARMRLAGPTVLALVGSHTKFVFVNAKGLIEGCVTTMAGELMEALSKNTMLQNSLPAILPEQYHEAPLIAGAGLSFAEGLSRAAFRVRSGAKLGNWPPEVCASFLAGAIFGEDAKALRQQEGRRWPARVVVAGRQPLRAALSTVLRSIHKEKETAEATDAECEHAAGYGMALVARRRWKD